MGLAGLKSIENHEQNLENRRNKIRQKNEARFGLSTPIRLDRGRVPPEGGVGLTRLKSIENHKQNIEKHRNSIRPENDASFGLPTHIRLD